MKPTVALDMCHVFAALPFASVRSAWQTEGRGFFTGGRRERIWNPAFHFQEDTQSWGDGNGGQSREAGRKKKTKTKQNWQSCPAVCFPIFFSTASCWYNKHLCSVPAEASAVPVGGLNRFTCWKALGSTGGETGRKTWAFEHFAPPAGSFVTQLQLESAGLIQQHLQFTLFGYG